MATLLDYNTLKHKSNAYLDEAKGISETSKGFQILMAGVILNLSDDEAEDSITDGPNDRGIDAVYIDDRNGKNAVHIFQFKYATKFEKSKNNFPGNEVDKVSTFLSDVLDMDLSLETSCNPLLWNKIKQIWDSLDRRNPSIEVHFCGNQKELADHEYQRAQNSIGKYQYVNIHQHTLDSISQFFIDKQRPLINSNSHFRSSSV